jgi:hypothetical protein
MREFATEKYQSTAPDHFPSYTPYFAVPQPSRQVLVKCRELLELRQQREPRQQRELREQREQREPREPREPPSAARAPRAPDCRLNMLNSRTTITTGTPVGPGTIQYDQEPPFSDWGLGEP